MGNLSKVADFLDIAFFLKKITPFTIYLKIELNTVFNISHFPKMYLFCKTDHMFQQKSKLWKKKKKKI